jgi:hypothetical protein
MDYTKLSFTYSANGYMLYYNGNPIGGAGVKLPREKPLHWKHVRANREQFKQEAQMHIAAIKAGKGDKRYLEAISKAEGKKV